MVGGPPTRRHDGSVAHRLRYWYPSRTGGDSLAPSRSRCILRDLSAPMGELLHRRIVHRLRRPRRMKRDSKPGSGKCRQTPLDPDSQGPMAESNACASGVTTSARTHSAWCAHPALCLNGWQRGQGDSASPSDDETLPEIRSGRTSVLCDLCALRGEDLFFRSLLSLSLFLSLFSPQFSRTLRCTVL
jgi:hypothetical protein